MQKIRFFESFRSEPVKQVSYRTVRGDNYYFIPEEGPSFRVETSCSTKTIAGKRRTLLFNYYKGALKTYSKQPTIKEIYGWSNATVDTWFFFPPIPLLGSHCSIYLLKKKKIMVGCVLYVFNAPFYYLSQNAKIRDRIKRPASLYASFLQHVYVATPNKATIRTCIQQRYADRLPI